MRNVRYARHRMPEWKTALSLLALSLSLLPSCSRDDNEREEPSKTPSSRPAEPLALHALVAALSSGTQDRYHGHPVSGLATYKTAMRWQKRLLYVFEAIHDAPTSGGNRATAEIAVDLGEGPTMPETRPGVATIIMEILPRAGDRHDLHAGATYRISGRFGESLPFPDGPLPILAKGGIERYQQGTEDKKLETTPTTHHNETQPATATTACKVIRSISGSLAPDGKGSFTLEFSIGGGKQNSGPFVCIVVRKPESLAEDRINKSCFIANDPTGSPLVPYVIVTNKTQPRDEGADKSAAGELLEAFQVAPDEVMLVFRTQLEEEQISLEWAPEVRLVPTATE